MEITDLNLGVAAREEVDADAGPNGLGEGEEELRPSCSNSLGLDGEVIAGDVVKAKALHSCIREVVPRAIAGTEPKLFWNW